MVAAWDPAFIVECNPSIEYLELFAMTAGIITWIQCFSNSRVILHCHNESVVHMLNGNCLTCSHCMVLIRIVVLQCLIHNVRIYVEHMSTKRNKIADSLSRLKMQCFEKLVKDMDMDEMSTEVPEQIWPISKISKKLT